LHLPVNVRQISHEDSATFILGISPRVLSFDGFPSFSFGFLRFRLDFSDEMPSLLEKE